jgi:hypothetical protein
MNTADQRLCSAGRHGYDPAQVPSDTGGGGSRPMTSRLPDFDQWIDAMAPVLRLEIAPEHRAGVKNHLKTAAKMAALLDKVQLPAETEAAPVFRA